MRHKNDRVYYVVERKSLKKEWLDLDLIYAMRSKTLGYDVDYALREDGQFKDYADGILHLDFDYHYHTLIDRNNVSVICNTYDKLPIIVSYLIGRDCTQESINDDLKDLVSEMQKHIDGFKGFSFELIKSQKIDGTNWVQPIEYTEDDELLFNTGDYWLPEELFKKLDSVGISIFNIALSPKYILIIDETDDGEFKKMIVDGVVDLRENNIYSLSGYYNFVSYSMNDVNNS